MPPNTERRRSHVEAAPSTVGTEDGPKIWREDNGVSTEVPLFPSSRKFAEATLPTFTMAEVRTSFRLHMCTSALLCHEIVGKLLASLCPRECTPLLPDTKYKREEGQEKKYMRVGDNDLKKKTKKIAMHIHGVRLLNSQTHTLCSQQCGVSSIATCCIRCIRFFLHNNSHTSSNSNCSPKKPHIFDIFD